MDYKVVLVCRWPPRDRVHLQKVDYSNPVLLSQCRGRPNRSSLHSQDRVSSLAIIITKMTLTVDLSFLYLQSVVVCMEWFQMRTFQPSSTLECNKRAVLVKCRISQLSHELEVKVNQVCDITYYPPLSVHFTLIIMSLCACFCKLHFPSLKGALNCTLSLCPDQ